MVSHFYGKVLTQKISVIMEVKMKKSIKVIGACAVAFLCGGILTLVGCGPQEEADKINVNFVTGYSEMDTTKTIDKGSTVENPNSNISWFTDRYFNNEFNFASTLSANTTLYGKYIKGAGTESDPYQVAHELNLRYITNFGSAVNAHVKLLNDITYNSVVSDNYKATTFAGVFDGYGKTITLNGEDVNETGIFSSVTGTIKNLKIKGHIDVADGVGTCGVLANKNSGTIENIETFGTEIHWNSSGTTSNGYSNGIYSTLVEYDEITDEKLVGNLQSALDEKTGAGGVVGTNLKDGTIKDCTNNMNVRAVVGVGGMCAVNYGTVENCFNCGAVGTTGLNSATFDERFDFSYLGGIAGINKGTIFQCANLNQVYVQRLPWVYTTEKTQTNYHMNVGGIAGDNIAVKQGDEFVGGIIEECFNYGRTHGDIRVGGIAGQSNGYIANCSAYGYYAGRYLVGGIVGYQKDEDSGIVTNCSAMLRILSNTASAELKDSDGTIYSLEELKDGKSDAPTTTITEFYRLAKYATNSLYHNNCGTIAPVDPATGDKGSNQTTKGAELYTGYTTISQGVGENKWVVSDEADYEQGAIVAVNGSYQIFLSIKLAWQQAQITAIVDGVETKIDGTVGIDYINHVLTIDNSGKYTGVQKNNMSGVTNTEGFILPEVSVPAGKKLLWTTVKDDASTAWDGLLRKDITVYAMIVDEN